MYLLGPRFLGCWAGDSLFDICNSLTGTPATFWELHPVECEDLTERQIQSFQTLTDSILYVVLLYRGITGLATYLMYVRPVMHELRQLKY
jgi:hypothetical protein